MPSFFRFAVLASALALTACQPVNTTNGGAVGVQRQQYMFSMLSSQQVDQMYAQSYQKTVGDAKSAGKLDNDSADGRRVKAIAARLIPQTGAFRNDAPGWNWQVNLVKSDELNANCGPGGKIIFYSGLIDKLQLSDDEIAAVMGHEIAHALREHGREQMSRAYAVQMGENLGGALLGLDQGGLQLADQVVQYSLTLPNSRQNETEADLIGLELAARAGYNPNAALTLWQKMSQAGGEAPPEILSTHPADSTRMATLQAAIPKVLPLYEQARSRN